MSIEKKTLYSCTHLVLHYNMVHFQGCTSTHNGGTQFVRYAIYSIYGGHFEKQNGGEKEKKFFSPN